MGYAYPPSHSRKLVGISATREQQAGRQYYNKELNSFMDNGPAVDQVDWPKFVSPPSWGSSACTFRTPPEILGIGQA